MLKTKRYFLIFFGLCFSLSLLFFNTGRIKASCPPDAFEATCAERHPVTNSCLEWDWECPSGGSQTCPAGFYACSRGCCPVGQYSQASYYRYNQGSYYAQATYYPTPPTCTVSLTPDPASVSQFATQDFTASVVPSNGTVDQVNFSSSATSVATVSPGSDSSSPYRASATGVGSGTATIQARVIMGGSERCNDPATLTVTPSGPWWQVQDADVLTFGDLSSFIPPTIGEDFILPGLGGFPGVAIFGGSLADFQAGTGSGSVSETGWLANTQNVSPRVYDYDYFESLIPGDVIFNEITSSSVPGATFASGGVASHGYYWYRFDGTTGSTLDQDLNITSNVNVGNRRVVLLVKGADLNVGGQINVTDGSGLFLTIVGNQTDGTKGDINIDPSVGAAAADDLEGIYFADGEFHTGAGSNQLYIRGAVAAYGGMVLERDLPDNSTTPAEFFEYGLDQVLLYPPHLAVKKIRWKEVAP